MTKEEAKQLTEFVTRNAWRQSVFLYPEPVWEMSDPLGLLKLLQQLSGASDAEIEDWSEHTED